MSFNPIFNEAFYLIQSFDFYYKFKALNELCNPIPQVDSIQTMEFLCKPMAVLCNLPGSSLTKESPFPLWNSYEDHLKLSY